MILLCVAEKLIQIGSSPSVETTSTAQGITESVSKMAVKVELVTNPSSETTDVANTGTAGPKKGTILNIMLKFIQTFLF